MMDSVLLVRTTTNKNPFLAVSCDSEERRGTQEGLLNSVSCLFLSPILPNAKLQVEKQTHIAANAKSNSNIKEEQPRKTQPLTSI